MGGPEDPGDTGGPAGLDALGELSGDERERLEREALPPFVTPMLATLTDAPFSDPAWIFEPKLDGVRALAVLDPAAPGRPRLLSRSRQRLERTYPEIVDALAAPAGPAAVLDGEIVAFADGVASFSRLQRRMHVSDPDRARRTGVPVSYQAFDLLHLGGWSTRGLPATARKRLLSDALAPADPVRITSYGRTDGRALFEAACREGWEGLVAKRGDAPYRSGRSRDWLKLKCVHRQELVVGGWSEPSGRRRGFGSLLLGYRDGDDLVYAGRVGTGFDERTLARLARLLEALERARSPFDRGDPPRRGIHWAEPELVVEVAFGEWTPDGRLRHPRFLGIREDLDPREVRREGA